MDALVPLDAFHRKRGVSVSGRRPFDRWAIDGVGERKDGIVERKSRTEGPNEKVGPWSVKLECRVGEDTGQTSGTDRVTSSTPKAIRAADAGPSCDTVSPETRCTPGPGVLRVVCCCWSPDAHCTHSPLTVRPHVDRHDVHCVHSMYTRYTLDVHREHSLSDTTFPVKSRTDEIYDY